ncbi:MAG: NapC/NirT family cytochrome c [Gammaproteobacteria bacterium]|nr:NapC/NirT family cytochrome c [Gammaproteobacteria bacterium]
MAIRGRPKLGLMSRKVLLGTTVGASLFFMIVGVIFWGAFNTAMEATNTLEFCISCHEMEENVYREYTKTVHYNNGAGVRATCSDCHVPRPWVHKVVRKIQATNEVFHKMLGSIDTPEKFDAKRLKLARNVWRTMKATDSRECRNCHDFKTMDPENQQPRARKQHLNAMRDGNTCIDCHMGIAHKKAHDQLEDEDLDNLVAPNPALAIALPPQWQAFVDKQAAAKATPAVAAPTVAEEPIPETAAPAVEVAAAPVAAKPAAAPTGAALLDWSNVPARKVVIFYTGEGSMEWTLRGKDHGGARPFKAGDRCFDCHDEEAADMGDKIVNGEKLEPNVIPNKRGSIPVSVQAAHDGENLYMRFSWPQAEHAPVPFVDGGKMDPDNPMKLALMLATDEVEYADRAGCWGTCHADAKTMPFAPEGKDVTKYLTESRTEIEIKGRDKKPLGGWDKRKSEAEIKAELEAGHFMDLIRYKSGKGEVEDGYILADRVMEGGQGAEFSARQEKKQWVVEMKRKLKSDKTGDISLAPDQLYNFGFAIHDDYSNARYHHVSLGYKLGFDNDEAEINAIKK